MFESIKAIAREFDRNANRLNPILRANIDFGFRHCGEPRDFAGALDQIAGDIAATV
jgi:hypothetical protein